MTMLQSSINEVIQCGTDYSNDLSVRLPGFCNNGAFHYHLEVGFSDSTAEYVIRKSEFQPGGTSTTRSSEFKMATDGLSILNDSFALDWFWLAAPTTARKVSIFLFRLVREAWSTRLGRHFKL